MFNKTRSRRSLRLEQLERRELFSVTVKMSAGNLSITDVKGPTGWAQDNDQVAVYAGGAGVVVACNYGIANFNNAPWVTIPWTQTPQSDLKITMSSGNDAVVIGDPRLLPAPLNAAPGPFSGAIVELNQPTFGAPAGAPLGFAPTLVSDDVVVKLGGGDDILAMNWLGVGDCLSVDTQSAARLNTWAAPLAQALVDEAILGFNTIVGDDATINGQGGNDLVLLGASTTWGVQPSPPQGMIIPPPVLFGNDPLSIGDVNGLGVWDRLRINTGGGNDTVRVVSTNVGSVLDIDLHKGQDTCTLWSTSAGTLIDVAGHSSEKKALVDEVFGLSAQAANLNFSPSVKITYARHG